MVNTCNINMTIFTTLKVQFSRVKNIHPAEQPTSRTFSPCCSAAPDPEQLPVSSPPALETTVLPLFLRDHLLHKMQYFSFRDWLFFFF